MHPLDYLRCLVDEVDHLKQFRLAHITRMGPVCGGRLDSAILALQMEIGRVEAGLAKARETWGRAGQEGKQEGKG